MAGMTCSLSITGAKPNRPAFPAAFFAEHVGGQGIEVETMGSAQSRGPVDGCTPQRGSSGAPQAAQRGNMGWAWIKGSIVALFVKPHGDDMSPALLVLSHAGAFAIGLLGPWHCGDFATSCRIGADAARRIRRRLETALGAVSLVAKTADDVTDNSVNLFRRLAAADLIPELPEPRHDLLNDAE